MVKSCEACEYNDICKYTTGLKERLSDIEKDMDKIKEDFPIIDFYIWCRKRNDRISVKKGDLT